MLTYERSVFWDVLENGKPYQPFPWQARHIHAQRHMKRVILPCGRRGGKSSGMKAEISDEATREPTEVHGVMQHPLIYVVGPTTETSMKVWQPIWDLFVPSENGSYSPPLGFLHAEHDKNRRYIKLHNGTEIYGKTADDPRGLQGDRVTLAVVDEAHEIQDEAWANLMPSLLDSEGRLIAIGIPKGKGRFRSYYELGQGADPNFYSASVPSTANPVIVEQAHRYGYDDPIKYLRETVASDLTDIEFRQQYLAEWVEQDGQVFKNLDAVFDAPWGYAHAGQYNAMGLDIGKMHDFTVAYVGDLKTSKFLARDRFVGLDYSVAVPRIAKLYRAYGCSAIVMDTTGGGIPVRDFLVKEGCHVIDYTYTAKSKEELILTFAREVERGLVHLPKDDKELRREMELFEATVTGTRVSYNAPKGYFDDCLREGTLIKTATGYEEIENVKVGDLVYTHTGALKPVTELIKKPFNGEMHAMRFQSQLQLDLSYNHPLYAAMRGYAIGDERFNKRDWVLPGEWRKTYRAVTPLIQHSGDGDSLVEDEFYENAPHAHTNLHEWALDAEAATLLGRFLADGHAVKKHGSYRVELAFHQREADEAGWISRYLSGLGLTPFIDPMGNGGLGFKLTWNSKLMWHALRECYDARSEKRLPAWGYRLGVHLPLVLDGWLAGDGYRPVGATHQIGATTSRRLALEMRDIGIASGRAATLLNKLERKRYGKQNKPQFWVMVHDVWPEQSHLRRISESEAASHIKKHETYQYEGDVYNLEVDDDHSFIAEGIVVHNCVNGAALLTHLMAKRRGYTQSPVRTPYVTFGKQKVGARF